MKLLWETKARHSDPPDLAEVYNDSEISLESDSLEILCDQKSPSFAVQGVYTKYYPTEEEVATYEPPFVLCRERMNTKPMEDPSNTGEYETAMFEPIVGLVGHAEFWHVYDEDAKTIREDRAILFQSQENYERLISHESFSWCFDEINYLEKPTFGEQVIVNGIDTSELAIGDVFEIEGGHSPLVVEISAPRKACAYINYKHDTCCGLEGIQHYVHENNAAGWFARVLVAGELRQGMRFIRTRHPNPKWTLNYVHKALYGEGSTRELLSRVSSWKRDRKELEELIALPQLGEYEWKVEARKHLLKLDGIDWKILDESQIDPQTGDLEQYRTTLQRLSRTMEVFYQVVFQA